MKDNARLHAVMPDEESIIHVTVFRDKKAQSLKVENLTLENLRDVVMTTAASDKFDLPLLKLAVFGTQRTENNCLRNNDNVLEITGVEVDYDAKVIPFDDAVATVTNAKLRALVYTSPSHTEVGPKWRVLLPTSKRLPPGERGRLVAQDQRRARWRRRRRELHAVAVVLLRQRRFQS